MPQENLIPIGSEVALVAICSFLLGKYASHKEICNDMIKFIKTNPYAFYLKDKLANINFPENETEPLSRMEELLKYGFPGLDEIRVFSDFILSYDRRNRVAHWVIEHLRANCLGTAYGVNRRFSVFQSDPAISPLYRSHNYDYFHSGFDRGHLAAAANHKCKQTHCNETFYLSNISPQVGVGFNRDAWNNLEIYVRNLANTFPDVYVCTGSVYKPRPDLYVKYRMIGDSHVAVPTHFFKVVVCISRDSKFTMEAYLLPNAYIDNSVQLHTLRRPPEEIESVVGLKFFDKIKRNEFISINGVQVPQQSEVD